MEQTKFYCVWGLLQNLSVNKSIESLFKKKKMKKLATQRSNMLAPDDEDLQ